MDVRYGIEPSLGVDEFVDVLVRSTLAERRPVDDPARIARMLAGANLIVTARVDELLVGVARSLSDFAYCTYLSDLAVDAAHQRRGIGKRLIAETRRHAGEGAMLLLLAAPGAREYYGHVGMTRHESAWYFPR